MNGTKSHLSQATRPGSGRALRYTNIIGYINGARSHLSQATHTGCGQNLR